MQQSYESNFEFGISILKPRLKKSICILVGQGEAIRLVRETWPEMMVGGVLGSNLTSTAKRNVNYLVG